MQQLIESVQPLSRHVFFDCLYLFITASNSSVFLPALSLLPGQIPAQDVKCFSDGKADISRPISETRFSTTLVLKPGSPSVILAHCHT